MKWFNKKSNLDEMQELQLLKAESRGFWIGFLGLAAAMAVQAFLYGADSMRLPAQRHLGQAPEGDSVGQYRVKPACRSGDSPVRCHPLLSQLP